MVLTVHVRGYLEGIPMIISKLFSIGAYGAALCFIISGYLSYKSRAFQVLCKQKKLI